MVDGRDEPAFPSSYWATPESDQPNFRAGMSLRDYFAAQALTGLIARRPTPVDDKVYSHVSLAKTAYGLADAMLLERGRSGEAE